MTFRFEKLYADLVTTDGTVCVVYVANTRWGVLHHSYAGAEMFRPDGSLETLRATGDPRQWIVPGTSVDDEIRFPCEAGEFRLQYRPELDAWHPSGAPAHGLEWWVEKPRAAGEISWPGNPAERLEGIGYVDHVRLERRLRSIGLERLEWGRVHLGEATLVYCGVSSRNNETWQRAAWWPEANTEPLTWDAFEITRDKGNLLISVLPELPEAKTVLTPYRSLHQGPVVGAAPQPRIRDRVLTHVVAGRLADNRWISQARTAHVSPPFSGWAVHEVVGRGRHGPPMVQRQMQC